MSFVSFHIVFMVIAQVITMAHMLYLRRNHSTILAWLMAIMLFPYLAFLLYFLFGNRKIWQKSDQKTLYPHTFPSQNPSDRPNPIETVMQSHALFPTTHDNEVSLHFDGSEAFLVLMEEIRKAQKSIWISTYIFEHDATGRLILEALREKVQEGIDVKMVIDSVGSYALYFGQTALKPLVHAGARVVFFNPILHNPLKNYINLRNHRKIYLFDGRAVLSGGMNISDDYLGPRPSQKRWIDMLFRIEGGAVQHYMEIFKADFEYASGERVALTTDPPAAIGKSRAQVVPSGPDIKSDALYEGLLSTIYAATQKIWIITPYFVPDESILRALVIAHHRGVDVKLVTPRVANHWIVDISRISYMRELEENGIDVLLLDGTMLHTKAIVFDDYAVMLGSVNIDNRSLFLNYEVVSFVYSPHIVLEAQRWIGGLIAGSTQKMANASYPKRILENFMRIFSPQL